MKKAFQSFMAATRKFFGIVETNPALVTKICEVRDEHRKTETPDDPDTTTLYGAGIDKFAQTLADGIAEQQALAEANQKPKEPWYVKLTVGMAPDNLPAGEAWPEGDKVLTKDIANLMFNHFEKLEEFQLLDYASETEDNKKTFTKVLPYLRLEKLPVGLYTYPDGREYVSTALQVVIDPNHREYSGYLAANFSFDFGLRVSLSKPKHLGGSFDMPAHFCLEVDPTYRSYRSTSLKISPQEEIYSVVLCSLETPPWNFTKRSAERMLEPGSQFMNNLAAKKIRGEVGQPKLDSIDDLDARTARVMTIDEAKVGYVIHEVRLSKETIVCYDNPTPRELTLLRGVISPCGPMADVLRAHLENPGMTSHFGMRSFTSRRMEHGCVGSDIESIVTFDLVV